MGVIYCDISRILRGLIDLSYISDLASTPSSVNTRHRLSRHRTISSSPERSTTPTKWVASTTLQRRWASERVRNRRLRNSSADHALGGSGEGLDSSLDENESDKCTRFDYRTDSLLDINRAGCSAHAEYKKSFMSINVLKVMF